MIDTAIIGSGPAGSVAALKLARAGQQVAIIDKPDAQPYKIGESLPAGINILLNKLQLPALTNDKHGVIPGSISLWAGLQRFEDFAMTAQGPGWRLDRLLFDNMLLDAALNAGVKHHPALLCNSHFDGEQWQLDIGGEKPLQARFVIDAGGRAAPVARKARQQRIKGPALVAVWSVGRAKGQALSRTLIESVDDGWWYGAYLPGGEPVAIFHTDAQTAAQLKREPSQWRYRLRHTRMLREHINAEDFSHNLPTAFDARGMRLQQPWGAQWAACGDAALCFDPLSSQGIFNAMAGADMLTDALMQSDRESALNAYTERLKQIDGIYRQRRQAFCRQACDHHQTRFWAACLSDELVL